MCVGVCVYPTTVAKKYKMLGTIEDDPQLYIIQIEVRAMEMHLAVDLLQFGKWHGVLFSKDGSQSVQGYEMWGVGGGLTGIGMMAQLGMKKKQC